MLFVQFGINSTRDIYNKYITRDVYNNMYITRALIGRSPCLDQAIQTRKS